MCIRRRRCAIVTIVITEPYNDDPCIGRCIGGCIKSCITHNSLYSRIITLCKPCKVSLNGT